MFRYIKSFLARRKHSKTMSKDASPRSDTKNRRTSESHEFLTAYNLPDYAQLADWELLSQIGDGAFSTVYLARSRVASLQAAIKVVSKAHLNDTQLRNVFKEVTILRRVQHKNITKLYEFINTAEHFFLILELATGGEIFHRIVESTYFEEPLARHVIMQLASAVRYLHEEKGVVHRDIKPENVLYEKESVSKVKKSPATLKDSGIGRVLLADFGLSKVIWQADTATPCGTIGYTAPEILKHQRHSKCVDMWAIGCMLYTMLVGFPPFYDEDLSVLSQKVLRAEYQFMSPWWDPVSAEAKDLISHLLTVNPDQRYSIQQFFEHPWCQQHELSKPSLESHETLSRTTMEHAPFPDSFTLPPPIPEPRSLLNSTTNLDAFHPVVLDKLSTDDSDVKVEKSGLAMKAALDMSYAVYRKRENEILKQYQPSVDSPHLSPVRTMDDLEIQEEEGGDSKELWGMMYSDWVGENTSTSPHNTKQPFGLSMNGASILARRKEASTSV